MNKDRMFKRLCNDYKNLESENQRLREALNIYANNANWREDDWNVLSIIIGEYGNPGNAAREALKEGKGVPKC